MEKVKEEHRVVADLLMHCNATNRVLVTLDEDNHTN